MKKNLIQGAILVVISSFFYASYGIRTALMGDFFGGYTASALRSIIVLIILFPIAFLLKKIKTLNIKEHKYTLMGMVLASMFVWGPLYFAILEIGVARSLSVNYSMLVIGFIFFGWLFLSEKLTTTKIVSSLIGVSGLLVIFYPSFTGLVSVIGLLAASLSGFCAGAVMVLAKKLPYNPTLSSLMVWVVSVIANVPLAFILSEPLPKLGFHIERLYLIVFSIASILSTRFLLKGMKYIDAGSAGIIGLSEIIFGVIFGVFIFNENLTVYSYVGILLILVASVYPYLNKQESY